MKIDTRIQTFTGRMVDPFDFKQNNIDILDIAHALAHQCRFAGHCRFHYSVAQHCVLMAMLAPPRLALEALLHDAAEAYMIDIPRPYKALAPALVEAEQKIQEVIARRFNVWAGLFHRQIKALDDAMLAAEARQLFAGGDRLAIHWCQIKDMKPLNIKIEPWTIDNAKHEFLGAFMRLNHQRSARRAHAEADSR